MNQTQLENLTAFFISNVPARAMKAFGSVVDEMEFVGFGAGAVPPGGDPL